MLRDYRLYTYRVYYEYTRYDRDAYGDNPRAVHDVFNEVKKIVAPNILMAEAFLRQRHNHPAHEHRNFKLDIQHEEAAPYIVTIMAY